MERTESRTRGVALALTGLALLCVGLLAGVAEGQAGGKVTVLSAQQHAILDAGAVTVEVKGGSPKKSVQVEGLQIGGGAIPLTEPTSVDPGKSVINVPLSSAGRAALSGCAIEGLQGVLVKDKENVEQSASGGVTRLDRDLAVCSVGSDNPTRRPYYGPPINTANADRCDFLDPTVCMQPFPNDYFTVPDPGTDSGRRLNFQAASMPHNMAGTPIDPTDFNHADGFSPGNEIIVHIPEVTARRRSSGPASSRSR